MYTRRDARRDCGNCKPLTSERFLALGFQAAPLLIASEAACLSHPSCVLFFVVVVVVVAAAVVVVVVVIAPLPL